nr:Uncharacterised protein [Klebsiella pneumoniae]
MVDALIAEMLRQELIVVDGDVMSLNPSHSRSCSCWPLAPARRCSAMPSPSGC